MGNIQIQPRHNNGCESGEGSSRRFFVKKSKRRSHRHHDIGNTKQYVFGTLCLNSYPDVSRALKQQQALMPRRLQIGAKFLNSLSNIPSSHHKRSIRRVLRRGCLEVAMIGNNPRAPRRVYEQEIVFCLSRVQQELVQCLVLENLNIQPIPNQQNHDMAKVLAKLHNLNTLTVESSRMSPALTLELLKVLENKLPSLQHLTLNLQQADSDDSTTTLHGSMEQTAARLIQKGSLQSLTLPFYPTTAEFWQAVTQSTSLRELSLDCHNMKHLKDLQQVLLANTSSLQKLQLEQLPNDCQDIVSLAKGLSRNQTLQALTLIVSNKDSNNDRDDKEDADDENDNRPGLHATMTEHCHATRSIPELFTPVLEHDNFTLLDFELYRSCDDNDDHDNTPKTRIATPALEFYTQLNRKQRSHLMRDNNSARVEEEWKQTLIRAATHKSRRHSQYSDTEDLSTLYYWLRVQPTQWCNTASCSSSTCAVQWNNNNNRTTDEDDDDEWM